MAYSPTTWTQGVTPVNATNQNHLETQYTEASLSYNPDLFTAGFVLSGFVATKDGVTANLLDVTAGTAYLLQSADNTVRQRKLTSSTQTTSALSSTYHLWLQPDGTWYWSTSNAPAANSLFIAQVTTDGSGNIATVTDERPTTIALLPNMAGILSLLGGSLLVAAGTNDIVFASRQSGAATGLVFESWTGAAGAVPFSVGGQFASALSWIDNTGGFHFGGNGANNPMLTFFNSTLATQYWTPQAGAANWHEFVTWNGSTAKVPFGIGSAANGVAQTWVADGGAVGAVAGQATAGSFGVPVVVAQAINFAITVTTNQVPITFTPSGAALYRVSAYIKWTNVGNSALSLGVTWRDATSGVQLTRYFATSTTAAGSPIFLDGTHTLVAGTNYIETYPIVVYAGNAGLFDVICQDPSGTPNDVLSCLVERLA